MIIEPAANRNTLQGAVGVVNGVTSITLNFRVEEERNNMIDLRNTAVTTAQEEYGDLAQQYDLVMLCLPPITGNNWVAFAELGGWLSWYNGSACQWVSVQMHEVGHNLGFSHSNKNGAKYAGMCSVYFIKVKISSTLPLLSLRCCCFFLFYYQHYFFYLIYSS